MTAFDDLRHDPVLRDLFQESRRNLAARNVPEPESFDAPQSLPLADPSTGTMCAICRRPFYASAEYLLCKVCPAKVCRKGDCKSVHHAHHYVAFLKQQAPTEAA